MPYAITNHARARIAERGITVDALAAALDEETALRHDHDDGRTLWYRSRVTVVTDEGAGNIVTAYRVGRRWPKRVFGRT